MATAEIKAAPETTLSRVLSTCKAPWQITRSALARLMSDDGWALASHLALTIILAIFPFLIFVTALAGFLGLSVSIDELRELIFEGWPDSVASPIAREVQTVLTVERHDLLTFGILLTIWFASNGVEALRVALERAYGVQGRRSWWMARLLSILFALLGGAGLLVILVLIVLGPVLWSLAAREIPVLIPYESIADYVRYGLASVFLLLGLLAAHLWIPVGKRRVKDVLPGIIVTVVLWLVTAGAFGYYLSNFARYASTYAGLAGFMAALVFLNLNSLCFIFGAEVNAAIVSRRARREAQRLAAAKSG